MVLPLIGAIIVRAAAARVATIAVRRYVQRTLKRKIDDAIRKADDKLKKQAEDRAKNCPTCKPVKDPCRALKKGDPDGAGNYRGGSYNGTRGRGADGMESNHAPSASSSSLPKSQGPSVQMDRADHAQTRSYGGGQAAEAYRQRQERLINSGNFEQAFAMDVADMMDIASRGGDIGKYADAIAEAAAYVACLRKHGSLP